MVRAKLRSERGTKSKTASRKLNTAQHPNVVVLPWSFLLVAIVPFFYRNQEFAHPSEADPPGTIPKTTLSSAPFINFLRRVKFAGFNRETGSAVSGYRGKPVINQRSAREISRLNHEI